MLKKFLNWLKKPQPQPQPEAPALSPQDQLKQELMKLSREVMNSWGIVKLDPHSFTITYQHPYGSKKLVTLEASYSVVGIFLGDPQDPVATHFIYDAEIADRINMICRTISDQEEIQEAISQLAKLDEFKQP